MASVFDFVSEDTGTFSLSVNGFIPRTAFVPFTQDKEKTPEVLVKQGDVVREGQIIARFPHGAVHATIPGMVRAIPVVQFPDGKQDSAAEIALGGSFSYVGKTREKTDWQGYDTSFILARLRENGVVNTFSGAESLFAQITRLHPQSARILAVRLFDDDPSRVTECFAAYEHAEQIAEGAAIVAKAMQAAAIVFVYGTDAGDQRHPLEDAMSTLPAGSVAASVPVAFCGVQSTKYPAGFAREIAGAVRKMSGVAAPLNAIGNRDIYIDALTALDAYYAVACATPIMERYVHVTGDCLNAAAVIKVKIGTTLGDLAMHCGGFKRPVAKIVINGLVTGRAVSNLSIPITKMVKSVAFLPARRAKKQHDETCLHCGECRKICPVGLYPDVLYRSFIHGAAATALEKEFATTSLLCTECVLCNAVCPSRLPLGEIIPLLRHQKIDQGAVDEK